MYSRIFAVMLLLLSSSGCVAAEKTTPGVLKQNIVTLVNKYSFPSIESEDKSVCSVLFGQIKTGKFEEITPDIALPSMRDQRAKPWMTCVTNSVYLGTLRGQLQQYESNGNLRGFSLELDGNDENGKEQLLETKGMACAPHTQCASVFSGRQSADIYVYKAVNPLTCHNKNQNPLAAERVDERKYILVDDAYVLKNNTAEGALYRRKNGYLLVSAFDDGLHGVIKIQGSPFVVIGQATLRPKTTVFNLSIIALKSQDQDKVCSFKGQ